MSSTAENNIPTRKTLWQEISRSECHAGAAHRPADGDRYVAHRTNRNEWPHPGRSNPVRAPNHSMSEPGLRTNPDRHLADMKPESKNTRSAVRADAWHDGRSRHRRHRLEERSPARVASYPAGGGQRSGRGNDPAYSARCRADGLVDHGGNPRVVRVGAEPPAAAPDSFGFLAADVQRRQGLGDCEAESPRKSRLSLSLVSSARKWRSTC